MPGVRSKTPNLTPAQRSGTNTPSTQNWTIPNAALPSMKTVANANDNGASKYTLAVEMAKDKFKDDPDVNQSIFKNSVDEIYNGMKSDTDKSAHDLRGENALTDLGHLIGGGINQLNNGIGYLLDAGLDFVGGGIGDAVSNLWGDGHAGDTFRNLWSGEDLSVIPDMAEDILISKIPIAGIPLTVAKNAAQRTDEISEALSGRDAITQEKLNDWERGGRAAEAALGLGLSAVPGTVKSRSKSFAKAVDKLKESDQKEAEQALVKKFQELMDSEVSDIAKNGGKKAATETAEEATEQTAKKATAEATEEAAEQAAPEAAEQVTKEAVEEVPKAEAKTETKAATKEAEAEPETKKEPSSFQKAVDFAKNNRVSQYIKGLREERKDTMGEGPGPYFRRIAGLAAPAAEMLAGATAAYGADPGTSIGAYFGNSGANFMPALADAVLLTAGGRHLTNKALPHVAKLPENLAYKLGREGKKKIPGGYYAAQDMPFQAARAAAIGNVMSQDTGAQLVPEPEMGYPEILARLQAMQEEEQNG